VSQWETVYDAQIDLMTGLDGGFQARQVEGFLESFNRNKPTLTMQGSMANRLAAMTFNADPIFVEPEMQTIWEATIEGFQPEPLHATDLVTPQGFILLPRPLALNDVANKKVSIRAALWHPARFNIETPDVEQADSTVVVTEHSLAPKPGDDVIKVPVVKKENGYEFNGILLTLWHHTRDYDEIDPDLDRTLPPCLILSHIMPWSYETQYNSTEDPRSIVRPIQALWRLMQQTISHVTKERPSSPFRKRWARADMPEKNVTVVRLRRPRHERDEDHEPRTVDWTHRWLVGGHWRNQYSPSIGTNRQIWISPYVKGPEDKPLAPKRLRAFGLVR